MDTLHQKLCEKSKSYKSWHENSNYGMYHWAVFGAFILLVAYALTVNINTTYGDSGASLAASAAPSNSNRPTWAASHPRPAQDHILVKFKDGVSDSDQADVLSKHNFKQKDEIKQIGVKIVSIPSDKTPDQAVQDILAADNSSIDYAVVDQAFAPSFTPNDPLYPDEWHLQNISAPAAWDTTQGSSNVIVADLDTGVDCTHPDLAAHSRLRHFS